jgi:hypothetical protein
MLSEARIILPNVGNDGAPLGALQEALAGDLVDAFGGVTMLDTRGRWRSEDTGTLYCEHGQAFDVACPDNEATRIKLRTIAHIYADKANQETVYLRLPNGAVEFLRPVVAIAA